ncbi:MAG: FtsQ-type POTRA domain-containing protein [Clostridia bacterium]|nr:FtsQ-type POTRA domain-containing protein [Clostridia bacterium]
MTNKNKLKKEVEKRKVENKEAIKRKKKKKKIKVLIKLFVATILLIGGIAFALISPIFNIKQINVLNNEKVSSDTVISLSGLATNENIFKYITITTISKIKEEPYIENVKIKRKIPNTVEIEVLERKPKYCIKLLESYVFINEQGYLLEISEQTNDMPEIRGITTKEEELIPGARLNNDDLYTLEDIIKITNSVEKFSTIGKITTIDIDDKNEYSIYIANEKKTIHLGDCNGLNDKMRNCVQIIEKEKNKEGEIFINGDINNGFQPYFREKV